MVSVIIKYWSTTPRYKLQLYEEAKEELEETKSNLKSEYFYELAAVHELIEWTRAHALAESGWFEIQIRHK